MNIIFFFKKLNKYIILDQIIYIFFITICLYFIVIKIDNKLQFNKVKNFIKNRTKIHIIDNYFFLDKTQYYSIILDKNNNLVNENIYFYIEKILLYKKEYSSMIKEHINNNYLFLSIEINNSRYSMLTKPIKSNYITYFDKYYLYLELIIIILYIILIIIYSFYKKFIFNKKRFQITFFNNDLENINFKKYYIALINVDFVTKINYKYNIFITNRILKQIKKLILKELNTSDIFIEYTSKEFLIFIKSQNISFEYFESLLNKLRLSVIALKATLSIGALKETKEIYSLENLFYMLDIALYKSKISGKNCINFYKTKSNHIFYRNKLKYIIDNKQIICEYQPIKNLKTLEILHYEALFRSRDKYITIHPNMILPYITDTYLHIKLSLYIIEYNSILLIKNKNIRISINLTFDDFINNSIINMLLKYQNISNRLVIELLENQSINYNKFNYSMKMLKDTQYKICIDDFGIGYSNFNYLINLPISYIKIDASIIMNLDKNIKNIDILTMLKTFCNKHNIKLIPEHIEKQNILNILIDMGIKYGQGNILSKPKSYEELLLK